MEFASQYVYVPPLIEKPKRSALLPPVKKVRPRTPPPPPPVPLKEPSPLPSTTSCSTLQVDQYSPSPRTHSVPPSPRLRSPPSLPAAPEPRPSPGPARGQQEEEEHYCTILPGHGTDQTHRSASEPSKTLPLIGPPLPPRPAFLMQVPEYTMVLPSTPLSPTSQGTGGPPKSPCTSPPSGPTDKQPLPGNPNVILIDLDKIVTDTNDRLVHGEPTACPGCGSVLDTCYDNVVASCYFCQAWGTPAPDPPIPQPCSPSAPYEDSLFLLTPDQLAWHPDTLIVFCIDISGSMSITSRIYPSAIYLLTEMCHAYRRPKRTK